jgi:hypothetical protein
MIGIGISIFQKRLIRKANTAEMTLISTGDGTGVSTIRLTVSEDTTLTIVGDANFYTDAAGTLGESKTWTITAGALRTIYLKCTGSAVINLPDRRLITEFGNLSIDGDGWVSSTNAASLSFTPAGFVNLTSLRITGTSVFSGALPTGLTFVRLNGASINWTYSGALPTGLTFVSLSGASINWTYSGALPTGLTYLYLNGASINWTGLDIGNNGNITSAMLLLNYRISKMSSADMLTLLNQLTNRTGSLPSSITINDYADFASPPQYIVDAVDLLKTTKSITTVNLGA